MFTYKLISALGRNFHRAESIKRLYSSDHYVMSECVSAAVSEGRPVVALESTIITHGMPFPHNLTTALEVEAIVREHGATPATIAAIEGKIKIGIDREEMEHLADGSLSVHKISRRDLPVMVSQCLSGGTTVSATMMAAHHAGIRVFVTGGIGGVHRGVEQTMDISSDLTELSRTPVAVVSAGVKSILDIGRTLEYLETLGVCVVTLSHSGQFPAFFTADSGFKSPHIVANELQAAQLIANSLSLRLGSGLLIAVPIPDEYASSGETIETAIKQAVDEARVRDIRGNEVTPYILERVTQLTYGDSLVANIALIKHNASVGSKIAKELSSIQADKSTNHKPLHMQPIRKRITNDKQHRPVVVGGLIMDQNVKQSTPDVQADGATYPGEVRQILGGVARNIADVLARLGTEPLLISAIGDDEYRESVLKLNAHMDLSGVLTVVGARTAVCCVLLSPQGQLLYMVGDMGIFASVTPQHIMSFEHEISRAPFVCVDANLCSEASNFLLDMCQHHRVPVLFEPTDRTVAGQAFKENSHPPFHVTSPNVNELVEIYSALTNSAPHSLDTAPTSELDACVSMCETVTKHVPLVITTLGHRGLLVCHRLVNPDSPHLKIEHLARPDKMSAVYYPAVKVDNILSTVGAGDCMVAAFMWGLLQGRGLDLAVQGGMLAARLTLQSHHTVAPAITAPALSIQNIKPSVGCGPQVIM